MFSFVLLLMEQRAMRLCYMLFTSYFSLLFLFFSSFSRFRHNFCFRMKIFLSLDGSYINQAMMVNLDKSFNEIKEHQHTATFEVRHLGALEYVESLRNLLNKHCMLIEELHIRNVAYTFMVVVAEALKSCRNLRCVVCHGTPMLSDASVVLLFDALQYSSVTKLCWLNKQLEEEHNEIVANELLRMAPKLNLVTLECGFLEAESYVKLCQACARMPKLRKLQVDIRPPFMKEKVQVLIDHLVDLSHLNDVSLPFGVQSLPGFLLSKHLSSVIRQYIKPGIPQIIALCHARRYGKVENGRNVCALRRIPVDLLRMLGPMVVVEKM